MFIVCLHPEHTRPWVAEVPLMEVEAEEIMSRRREAIHSEGGGSAMVWTEHVDALGGASADVCIFSALCGGEDFTHTQTNDPGKCR